LLTADSATATGIKWAAAPVSLPSQTGNAGEFLTTDGTDASWAPVAGSLAQPTEPTSPPDGQIWVDTDGTAPTTVVTRWSKAPTAGTTTLTGTDDGTTVLAYTPGYEEVFLNGVLLSRTNDYTATTGTSVVLSAATVTGDIVEVICPLQVAYTDAITTTAANAAYVPKTLTTTTGDIIYASAANTPARLGIGSTDQVLKVSGGVPVWATPAASPYVGVGLTNYYATIAGTANVPFAVPFAGTESWDTDAFHDTSTNNSRITIPSGKAGKYLISSFAWPETFNTYFIMSINLNGAQILGTYRGISAQGEWQRQATQLVGNCTLIMNLQVGDYIEQTIQMGGTASYRYINNLQATYLGA
jgi:hypothetical protein